MAVTAVYDPDDPKWRDAYERAKRLKPAASPVATGLISEMDQWRDAHFGEGMQRSENDHYYGAWHGARAGKMPQLTSGTPAGRTQPQGWSERRATAQAKHTMSAGGTTAKAFGTGVPHKGFMVSPYPQHEKKLPLTGQTPKTLAVELRQYIEQHRDILGQPQHYLGAWVDNGTIYEDISIRAGSQDEAAKLAKQYNQKAAYNLETGESVFFSEANAQERRQVIIHPDATDKDLEDVAAYLLGQSDRVPEPLMDPEDVPSKPAQKPKSSK